MTDPSRDTAPSSSRRRLPAGILLGVGILVAGWTAAWSLARSRLVEELDAGLARAAAQGVRIVCPDRSVGGWPVRLEVTCRDPGVEMPTRGIGGSVAALRVVAQIWDPKLVLLEADGPMVFETAGQDRVDATWRRLSASLRWRIGAAERLSLSIEGLDATLRRGEVAAGRLQSEHLEAHGRSSGATGSDADVAVSAAGSRLEVAGRRVGPPRSDVSVDATLRDLLPPDRVDPMRGFAARGGRIEPIRASFAVGGVRVAGKGELRLGSDGLLDGMVTLAAQGLETVATDPASLGPETAGLLGGFVLLGKASRDPELPGRRLELVVDHGHPRLGRVQFPPIPPLFRP